MNDVVIVSAVRTPICRRGHQLKEIAAIKLASLTMGEAMVRAGTEWGKVDQIIFGCVFQQGENAYLARAAGLSAGFAAEIPAFTVNGLCSSGLLAVSQGAQAIRLGQAGTVMVGGAESSSQVPFMVNNNLPGQKDLNLINTVDVVLTDPILNKRVGWTAEKLAEEFKITREEQDAFAWESNDKAIRAGLSGYLQEAIIPVAAANFTGESSRPVHCDGGPREGLTMGMLARHKPVFLEGGTVTAGNSSLPADGAAAMLLMAEESAYSQNLQPLAIIKEFAFVGTEPNRMGMAAAVAIQRVLTLSRMDINNIELFECTESFAAQMLAVGKSLGWDWSRVNVNGGTIAFGHPLGASGAIQLIRLIHELRRRGGKYGIAACCAGGGLGAAILIEAC